MEVLLVIVVVLYLFGRLARAMGGGRGLKGRRRTRSLWGAPKRGLKSLFLPSKALDKRRRKSLRLTVGKRK